MEFRNFGVFWKKNPAHRKTTKPFFQRYHFFLIFVDPEIQWCWLDSSNRVLVTSENAAKSGLLLSGIVFSLLGVDPALFRSFRTRMLLWRLGLRLGYPWGRYIFGFWRFSRIWIVFAINFFCFEIAIEL